MTLPDQLREESFGKGFREGLREGRQEVILQALAVRFGEVPAGLAEAISAVSDEACLRRLYRAAILSASVDEFAGGL